MHRHRRSDTGRVPSLAWLAIVVPLIAGVLAMHGFGAGDHDPGMSMVVSDDNAAVGHMVGAADPSSTSHVGDIDVTADMVLSMGMKACVIAVIAVVLAPALPAGLSPLLAVLLALLRVITPAAALRRPHAPSLEVLSISRT